MAVGSALAKGVISGAGSWSAQKALSRMELLSPKPLKESIGVIFGLSIQIADLPEDEVATAYAKALRTLKQYRSLGYQPDRFVTEVNGSKVEILLSTYGTLDELNDDELGELYEGMEDHDPLSLLEPDSVVEDIQPTISSLSVFFVPTQLNQIDDLLKLNELVTNMNQELTSTLSNKGSLRSLFLTMTKDKFPELSKLVNKISAQSGMKQYEFKNQNGELGFQVLNPSDTQLREIVKGLKREFGGTFRKLNPARH